MYNKPFMRTDVHYDSNTITNFRYAMRVLLDAYCPLVLSRLRKDLARSDTDTSCIAHAAAAGQLTPTAHRR